MHKEVKLTNDGSKTLYIPEMDETYHSSHGALQEAIHVFIENGVKQIEKKEISIFEMGFGTGLNALLSWIYSNENNRLINYLGIEAYPVDKQYYNQVNHGELISREAEGKFQQMHEAEWDKVVQFDSLFNLKKLHQKIENWQPITQQFDIVYFDAFGPRAQSDMWDVTILKKMYDCLKSDGFLVTYCAKGQVKRDLKSLGFTIEALPGPPGKREMTRAWKSIPKHLQ